MYEVSNKQITYFALTYSICLIQSLKYNLFITMKLLTHLFLVFIETIMWPII